MGAWSRCAEIDLKYGAYEGKMGISRTSRSLRNVSSTLTLHKSLSLVSFSCMKMFVVRSSLGWWGLLCGRW